MKLSSDKRCIANAFNMFFATAPKRMISQLQYFNVPTYRKPTMSTRQYPPFLTCELRACARASCIYVVGNGTRSLARSLDWSIPVNFFFDFRLLSAFDSFWRVINKRNGDLFCEE